ncbi:MAG: hypothetical protein RLZZ488_2259 [Pseudomonadota bacterium]
MLVRKTSKIAFAFVVFFQFSTACRQEQSPAPFNLGPVSGEGENFIVPSPRARIIRPEDMSAFSQLSSDGRLSLEKSVRGVSSGFATDSFKVGDVLVLPPSPISPLGALRRINFRSETPTQILLATSQASLTDAVSEASVRQQIALESMTSSETSSESGEVVSQEQQFDTTGKILSLAIQIKDFVIADRDGRHSTRDDQLRLNSLFRSQLGADVVIRIKNGFLQEFSYELSGSEYSQFSIAGSVDVPITRNWPIIRANYKPVMLTIGGFPIVLTPSSVLELTSQIAVTGDLFLSGSRESEFRSGLSFVNGRADAVREYRHHGTSLPPYVQVPKGKLKVGFRLKSELSLYDMLGAYASLRLYSSHETSLSDRQCFRTTADADTAVGLYLQALGILLGKEEKSWDLMSVPVAEGACRKPEISASDSRTYAWRYFYSPAELKSSARIVFERSQQEGLVMSSSAGNQTQLMRFAHDGSVVTARRQQSSTQTWSVVRSLQDGGQLLLSNGQSGYFAQRVDSAGMPVWSYRFAHQSGVRVAAADENPDDGALFIVGQFNSSENHAGDDFVAKLSSSGELLWTRLLSSSSGHSQVAAVRSLRGGRLVLGGSVELRPARQRMNSDESLGWIAIADSDGSLISSKLVTAGSVVSITEPISQKNNELAVLGYADIKSADAFERLPWIVTITQDAAITMITKLSASVHPYSLMASPDGLLLAGAWLENSSQRTSGADSWLAAVDFAGNVSWSRRYSSAGHDELRMAYIHRDGRLIAGGFQQFDGSTPTPVVFNLSKTGHAQFTPESGFTASVAECNRITLPLSGLPYPLSSERIDTFIRQPNATTEADMTDVRIERMGAFLRME